MKKASSDDEAFSCYETFLHAERRSAAAGAFHVRILELESRTLEGLHVIHDAAVEIHDRRRIDEYLQAVHFEGLVHHSGAVLKLHGIRETGASAADDSNAQSGRNRVLLRHDLFHLGNGIAGQGNGCGFLDFRDGCGGHSYLLGFKAVRLYQNSELAAGTCRSACENLGTYWMLISLPRSHLPLFV